jgi:hypothetical protein
LKMRQLDYIDSFEIGDRWHEWRCLAPHLRATRCYGGSASSQSNPSTLTTSGSSSPILSGGGSAATAGSIALGAGSKYQESGSIDLSGANLQTVGGSIKASGGSTVNVGDPALETAIGQVINDLSSGGSIPVSLAGGNPLGSTTVVPITSSQPSTSSSWLDNVNWTLVAIVGAGFLAAGAILFLLFGRER